MGHDFDIEKAQVIIGYPFQNQERLNEALQAATRHQDRATRETLYWSDGNRRLAQLGHKVLELVLLDECYESGRNRSESNVALSRLASKDYLANIAMQSGLDICTTPSDRQENQAMAQTTLKLTVTAICGAVWLDSDKTLEPVRAVMRKLRILPEEH